MKSPRETRTSLKSPESSSPPEMGSSAEASSEPPLASGPRIETHPEGADPPGDKAISFEEINQANLDSEKTDAAGVDEDPPIPGAPPSLQGQTPSADIKQSKWKIVKAGAWCPAEFVSVLEEELVNLQYRDEYSEWKPALPGWKLLGATRRGRMHANNGRHREDAFRSSTTANSIVLCVSDGAGSSQFSRVGAELTTRRLTHELSESFKRDQASLSSLEEPELAQQIAGAMSRAVYTTITFLHETAEKAKCTPKDLRCTLLLAVVYTNEKAKILLTSQVGDGFFARLYEEGKAQRFGASDSGEFSGQVTCFIPDPEAPAHAKNICSLNLDKMEALILCTDGIEDPFYPIERNAKSIFDQLYHGVRERLPGFEMQAEHGPVIGEREADKRLMQWLSFEKKGENDDRTILILHRDPVGEVSGNIHSLETVNSEAKPADLTACGKDDAKPTTAGDPPRTS
jgi:serine/threonine protein phosphatase PrpC